VHLWAPGNQSTPWDELSGRYGLNTPFEITWLPCNPALKRYDLAAKAVHQAQQWKAGIIYTWLPQAAVLGQRRALPIVLEVHDRPTGRLGPWLLRHAVTMAGRKRIAVITRALATVLRQEFNLAIPEEVLVIAPNGADLERFEHLPDAPSARAQLGLPPDRLTAVYSGHLYPGRGIDLVLRLAQAFPQVGFLIVGGNPEAVESYCRQAADTGLGNVTLTGFVENQRLPLYQAAGDILLMPYGRVIAGSSGGNSADICSPMKLFEYLATGRAILTSDLPVFREVLNERNAVFCQAEGFESWQAGLQELINHPEKRQALAQQARLDARLYAWTARSKAILDHFEQERK
jgi:glycosyltransferase involved in cell wall biosynthesis